jgi:hypothetical protein
LIPPRRLARLALPAWMLGATAVPARKKPKSPLTNAWDDLSPSFLQKRQTMIPKSTTPEMDRNMRVLLVEGTVTMSSSRLTGSIYAIKGLNG